MVTLADALVETLVNTLVASPVAILVHTLVAVLKRCRRLEMSSQNTLAEKTDCPMIFHGMPKGVP